MRKFIHFWLGMILLIGSAFAQQEGEAPEEPVINQQVLIDSIKGIYEQKIQTLQDSLSSDCQKRILSVKGNLEEYYQTKTREFELQIEKRIEFLKDSMQMALLAQQEQPFNKEEENRAYEALRKILQSKERETGFFNKFIGGTDEKLDEFQVEQSLIYLHRFEPKGHSATVLDEIISNFRKRGDWDNLVLYGLRLLMLYPDSTQVENVRTDLRLVVKGEDIFENKRDILVNYIDSTYVSGDFESSLLKYITVLNRCDRKRWYEAQSKIEQDYILMFPDAPADELLFWEANRLMRVDMNMRALLTFQKIATEYPDSDYLSRIYFGIARIYDTKFKDFEAAIDAYDQFLNKFPDDTLALDVRYRIATIYDNELKNWLNAIENYKNVQANHPGTQEAKNSLLRVGEILWKELKDDKGAIKAYENMIQQYKDSPEAEKAIFRIGNIYLDKKEYQDAVETYNRIYEEYPESELLLKSLVKTAEIQEKYLKDKESAISTLNKVVELFPDSDEAKKARKKISKLQKG